MRCEVAVTLMMTKSDLRKQIRATIRTYSEAEKLRQSEAVFGQLKQRLASLVAQKPQCKVAWFMGSPLELKLQELHLWLTNNHAVSLLPRVISKAEGLMSFHEVSDVSQDLIEGGYGLMEPRQGLSAVSVEAVDVWICPGVAFTSLGQRLGQGGGYYDRVLARRHPDSLVFGVGFDCQLVEAIPCELFDQTMNEVFVG